MSKINRKDFNKFIKDMWKRLERGKEKYGDTYEDDDIVKELEEELMDVANYAFMLWLKIIKISKKFKVK